MEILNKKVTSTEEQVILLSQQLSDCNKERDIYKKRLLALEDRYRKDMKDTTVSIEKNRRQMTVFEDEIRPLRLQIMKLCKLSISGYNNIEGVVREEE